MRSGWPADNRVLPPTVALSYIIIQHIVTLPKYGHGKLNLRRPQITDILRYNLSNIFARARLV